MTPISNDHRSAGLRIAILSRQYWPTTNDTTLRLSQLIYGLGSLSARTVVVTPRWHSTWPKRVTVEETPVDRLDGPPISQLQQAQYRRTLSDWLDANAASLSCVYVDEPGLDALAICRHRSIVEGRIPVVVRFDPLEIGAALSPTDSSYELWQPTQSALDSCGHANRILVPRPSSQQMLLRFGIPAQQIKLCSDWYVRTVDRTPAHIREARKALADINSDLSLLSQQRLLVVPGSLGANWDLNSFVRSVAPALDRQSSLKVWIHGDGNEREGLYDLLQFLGHHRNVIMPGVITSISTLVQAADLLLFPSPKAGHSWLIPAAIISGVPLLVADSADLRWQLGHLSSAISYNSNSASELQWKLEQWIKDPSEISAATRCAGQLIRRQSGGQSAWEEICKLATQFTANVASKPKPHAR